MSQPKVNLAKYLNKIIVHPPQLTPEDLVVVFDAILNDSAPQTQIAAFLALLRGSGIDHYPSFISAAAQRMMKEAYKIDPKAISDETQGDAQLNPKGYVDIVGTGGDGQNTFNVSTTASIVAAGMDIDVCKHGGKAATSSSGAGDLLSCLGVDLANVSHVTAPGILKQSKYCFLFAPVFHPAMAKIAILRKEIGIPTIFNILGPLLNPVPIKARIIGVYDESLGEVFAQAVYQLNVAAGRPWSKAMIVWGTEGLDEISPAGTTKTWTISPDGSITAGFLHPNDFGLPVHPLSTVKSGTPKENSEIVKKLVANELPENNPILDYVLMNAAALAFVEGTAKDLKHGVELAKESIKSGKAKIALEKFVSLSRER